MPVFGGGLEYHVNPKWDLTFGGNYSPPSAAEKQPHTLMWSSGLRYNMRPLPPERGAANREAGYVFPETLLQLDYTTNGLGYGSNKAVSSKVPLFWAGDVQIAQGVAVHYDRNVFHTRRLFSLDIGASASYLRSRKEGDDLATLSVYPLLRFTSNGSIIPDNVGVMIPVTFSVGYALP